MSAISTTSEFHRLPAELAKPSLYELSIVTDLKVFKFEGQINIHLEVTEATDNLILHASNLLIHTTSLKLADEKVIQIPTESVELNAKSTLLTVHFPHTIQPQKVILGFNFSGEITETMQGFYRSAYKDESGAEKFIASTFFESTFARHAFPCWDEPIFKAKFSITLEVDPELVALSNMPVEKSWQNEGRKVLKFATTPPMSTYLVAYAVGDFECIKTTSKGGVEVGVYAIKGSSRIDQGQFGLEVGAKCLDWYSEWFGSAVPLPKCDLLAVPNHPFAAMEQWGLVTFLERFLLVDPVNSSFNQKSDAGQMIAHELAHFWFGNLVTMKWWTDLWLKEGFAEFMEYKFLGANYPEFKIWLRFLRDETFYGFALDSLRNSHPIEVQVENPNELVELYDAITYRKTNALIRMLCDYLGESDFQKGLRAYLAKFAYGNAQTTDLWKCFSEASGKDIDALMSSWTKQMGYPLISVISESQLDGNRREIRLKQERFLADGGVDESRPLWQIPISFSTSKHPEGPLQKVLMGNESESFVIDGVGPEEWVKLNSQTMGFFHVLYPEQQYKQLLAAVAEKKLGVLDRFGFVLDVVALVKSGKAPIAQFLDLIRACKNETEFVVWSAIDSGIATLALVLEHFEEDLDVKSSFAAFVCAHMESAAKRLGWASPEGEDCHVGLLRDLLLNRLSTFGHRPTVETALKKFDEYASNNVELVPDLRGTILATVGREGGEAGFEKLIEIFETSKVSEVRPQCLKALGQAADAKLLQKIYDYGVLERKLRPQELIYLFIGSAQTKLGRSFVWEHFKQNLSKILEIAGSVNSTVFQHCLKLSTNSNCSESIVDDFESFSRSAFDDHQRKVLERVRSQIVEAIRLKVHFLNHSAADVKRYLDDAGF